MQLIKMMANLEQIEDKCKYCGACKNACPANAFMFERNFKDSIEEI